MKKLYIKIIKLIHDNWADPVWSKVISAIIISLGSFLLGLIYFGVGALLNSKSLLNGLKSFARFLNSSNTIILKNYVLGLLIILFLSALIPLFRLFKKKKKFNQQDKDEDEVVEEFKEERPKIFDKSTVFFEERMAESFPGQRGLKWYKNPESAVNRLSILLRSPLSFNPDSPKMSDPVWWFRGTSNLHIGSFTKLTKSKILLDIYEYDISEIAVYRDDVSYEKDFIYVKVKAQKPVGVYEWFPEDIERNKKQYGFCREEYGLYNNKTAITREEYDDGAAEIKGKVIDTRGSRLRIRYLTDYNFIIAAKQSPINSHEFDRGSKEILNGILQGTHTFENLFDFIYPLNNPMC